MGEGGQGEGGQDGCCGAGMGWDSRWWEDWRFWLLGIGGMRGELVGGCAGGGG